MKTPILSLRCKARSLPQQLALHLALGWLDSVCRNQRHVANAQAVNARSAINGSSADSGKALRWLRAVGGSPFTPADVREHAQVLVGHVFQGGRS
jgi:hypothetical protein